MTEDVFEIIEPGLGATLQDRGRSGWRRFGVPPGGVMDDHAALWANRLLDNPPGAPVIELLLQGARLRARRDVWIALTGADAAATVPTWRAVPVSAGRLIELPHNRSGVWSYLAVEGGFAGETRLGSVSAYPRGQLGEAFGRGAVASRALTTYFELPRGVAGRAVDWNERRDYDAPPRLRVWPGPQWDWFSDADRERLFTQDWTMSSQSDRVGYRLAGEPLQPPEAQMISEPVLVGSIQIPPGGLPIVTMRDGPTVGGYPKVAVLDPAAVPWLAQCRPGTKVRFELVHETRPEL
jgi:biotin-dependent carboxylase-like uncharacterized protein